MSSLKFRLQMRHISYYSSTSYIDSLFQSTVINLLWRKNRQPDGLTCYGMWNGSDNKPLGLRFHTALRVLHLQHHSFDLQRCWKKIFTLFKTANALKNKQMCTVYHTINISPQKSHSCRFMVWRGWDWPLWNIAKDWFVTLFEDFPALAGSLAFDACLWTHAAPWFWSQKALGQMIGLLISLCIDREQRGIPRIHDVVGHTVGKLFRHMQFVSITIQGGLYYTRGSWQS